MTRTALAAVVAVAAYAPPALADEYYAVTPSGAAEMVFAGQPEDVVGRLSGKCIDAKWTVTSSSSTELVCEAPMNFGQSLLGTMLMGNSYSTPPRRFFRFNAASVAGVSRVQASGWMELQMAFGQMKRTDFTGPTFQNSILLFMFAAGGKFPIGTTFPNHAFLGFDYTGMPVGKKSGLAITSVVEGQPAARAGLRPGDVVVTIAGKTFKSNEDILDAFAKAAKSPTYPVVVLRDGRETTVTVERAFKPPATETVEAATAQPAPAAAASPPVSVADELAKLAKLRADGVLTDAEFQAQKARVLQR